MKSVNFVFVNGGKSVVNVTCSRGDTKFICATLEDNFLIVQRPCNFILVRQKPNIGLPSYFVSKLGDVQ